MMDSLKVGDIYDCKEKIFEYFKDVITSEKLNFINKKTHDIPLDKVNKLLNKENYIWLNILEENEWRDKFKDNNDICIVDNCFHSNAIGILQSLAERMSFLFIKKEQEYVFLGLYEFIKKDEQYISIFRRVSKNLFQINKTDIKNMIDEINFNNIKSCINDRTKLINLLKENGERFEYLPSNLKDDKELCLIAMDTAFESPLKYVSKSLLNNMEFAKKVAKKCGFALKFFSQEIANDIALKKIALQFGFDLHKHDIKEYIDTDVKDAYIFPCSIISIDDFGNEIIDTFLQIEKERHSQKRNEMFDCNLDLIQFVKIEKSHIERNSFIDNVKFNKKLFDKELHPLIILIGKEDNTLSKEIKKEYQSNGDRWIIEVYENDSNTNNFKLITKDKNTILDLLRIIAYSTSSDDILPQSRGTKDIKMLMQEQIAINNDIKIYKFKSKLEDIKQGIVKIPKKYKNKINMVQLIINDKVDAYLCNTICNMIFEEINSGNIEYYASHVCNIDDVEIILWLK